MHVKGERVCQGHRAGGFMWSVTDLLIGHPEMINFATSFWAGFASHPRSVLLPNLPTGPWSHSTVPLEVSDSQRL